MLYSSIAETIMQLLLNLILVLFENSMFITGNKYVELSQVNTGNFESFIFRVKANPAFFSGYAFK